MQTTANRRERGGEKEKRESMRERGREREGERETANIAQILQTTEEQMEGGERGRKRKERA